MKLMEYLVAPVAKLRNCKAVAYGVRYPEEGRPVVIGSGN